MVEKPQWMLLLKIIPNFDQKSVDVIIILHRHAIPYLKA